MSTKQIVNVCAPAASQNHDLMKNAVVFGHGATLFRTAPHICDYTPANIVRAMRSDPGETEKTGVYFGTYMFIALAMVIEYKKDLELGIFKTTKPIFAIKGKYAHQDFIDNDQEKHIYEHLNHFDPRVMPIVELDESPSVTYDIEFDANANGGSAQREQKEQLYAARERLVAAGPSQISADARAAALAAIDAQLAAAFTKQHEDELEKSKESNGELFIGDANDLSGVQLIETYRVSYEKLRALWLNHREGCTRLALRHYLDAGVLTPMSCPAPSSSPVTGGYVSKLTRLRLN